MAKNKYYLTTAIPYVNGRPHIGHALEYVVADTIHRYQELTGKEVFVSSGADENALKNVQAAEKEELPVQKFLDRNSKVFEDFYKVLGVELNEFRRGSDETKHWPGVQKLWGLVEKAGDLYKKKYKGLYCIGCESFKTEKELVDGKCPEHDRVPEIVEEENYFFKLSKYQDKILKLIETDEYKILPEKRKNEALSFIKSGLEDFSVSRSNKRARGVGVPIPGDNAQKIFVWFDALAIYMTAVGYGTDKKLWKKWWPADLHIIGKDIFRFHAVYWPAILLSADLPLPKQLLVHGFVTSAGRKMSKSIGNVVDPYEIIEKYGVEPLRYFLISQIPTLDDGDFTEERFREVYQADLANGLGNLVSRIAKLCEKAGVGGLKQSTEFEKPIEALLKNFNLNQALAGILNKANLLDNILSVDKPWEISNIEELKAKMVPHALNVLDLAHHLKPFLPNTSRKIEEQFTKLKIRSGKPLFPRLD